MLRPGVAMASAIGPLILLLHEWFLAGNAEIMELTKQRLEAMVRGGEVLLSSPCSTEIISNRCTRRLWQDRRSGHMDGLQDASRVRFWDRMSGCQR